MNCYRFPIRTHCNIYGFAGLAIDLAVSIPPALFEPLLEHHRLVDGVAIGLVETEAEAKAAHNDLVETVKLIDALGLQPAEDQSAAHRNRKLSLVFDRPIVLTNDAGDLVVLDRRAPVPEHDWADYLEKNPLRAFGWTAGTLTGPVFSDGTAAQVSSPVQDVLVAAFERAGAYLIDDSHQIALAEVE